MNADISSPTSAASPESVSRVGEFKESAASGRFARIGPIVLAAGMIPTLLTGGTTQASPIPDVLRERREIMRPANGKQLGAPASSEVGRQQTTEVPAHPAETALSFEPSVIGILQPWSLERVSAIARIAREKAPEHGVVIDELVVTGHVSPEDDKRQIILSCWVQASNDAAFAYWDELAEVVSAANRVTPPRRAKKADVRLAVSVRWDVG